VSLTTSEHLQILILLYTTKLNMQDSIFDIFGTQDSSRQSTVKAVSKTYVQPLKGRVVIIFFWAQLQVLGITAYHCLDWLNIYKNTN